MVYATETQFLTRELTISLVVAGRHLFDARLQYDRRFQFALGCTICRHQYLEHVGQREWERAQVTHNGCRCCATTKVIPVVLLIEPAPLDVAPLEWPA